MLQRLRSAMNFTPRRWYAEVSKDGTHKAVTLIWARKAEEAYDDHVAIVWNLGKDGPVLEADDRLFALGSAAFAINAIQQDVDNEDPAANVKFLRDPKNLDFIDTPNGKLGDLLVAARCRLMNPTYLLPVTAGWVDGEQGLIRLQVSVNCPSRTDVLKNPDDTYHYIGALIALKLPDGAKDWTPTSFLATRIWKGAPGHWADVKLPIEGQVFAAAKAAAALADRRGFGWLNVARVIELRNSGRPLAGTVGETHAFETAALLLKIQTATDDKVTPTAIEGFLRHAGFLATTISDKGIVDAVPTFGMTP